MSGRSNSIVDPLLLFFLWRQTNIGLLVATRGSPLSNSFLHDQLRAAASSDGRTP
jgi:hypothetical protein